MSQIRFKSKSVFIGGLLVAAILITARTWAYGQSSPPPQDVTVQNQPDGVSPHLQATFTGNVLIGTVTVSDKDGRPWAGTRGQAYLSDSSGRPISVIPLQPLSPGEFRLVAPLGQLDASGYLEVRVPARGQTGEHRAVYEVDRDRQTITWTGTARQPEVGSEVGTSASLAPQATGGPDEFGYTWDDSTTYEWEDTSGGTPIALRDDDFIGPYDIGFEFIFYGHPYTQFYVDSNGYIGFDGDQTESSYANSPLPYARRPNSLIAPFWDDFDPSQGGTVRYQTFGSAPNRYLVVEWSGVPLWYSPSDAQSFQLILYEGTNDIEFQYPATRQGVYGDRRYGTVGIENQDGTIGLEYPYLIPTTITRAVLFEYHQSAYNVFLTPAHQGSPAAAGGAASFQMMVKNLGAWSDSFTLSAPGSSWPVSFYEADGTTPLSGNSTGTIPAASEKEIVVKVQIPGSADAGDWRRVTIQARSQGNAGETHQVQLDTTVGTSFVQVYTDDESGDGTEDSENYIDFLVDGQRYTRRLTTDQDNSSYAGVATTPDGHAVAVWNTKYYNGTAWVNEIQYAVLNRYGSFVEPVVRLTDNSAATQRTTDFSPAVDVALNGNVAIGWARQVDTNGDGDNDRYNVWYAVMGSDGSPIKPPIALTNNTSDYPRDYPPSVAALTGGRFLLAWEHAELSGDVVTVDVYYAMLNSNGTVYKAATALTDGPGWNATPRVAPLPDGQAAVVWTAYNSDGYPEIDYATVGSNGTVTGAPEQITSNGDSGAGSRYADAIALSDGRLAVAWTQYSDDDEQIQYTIVSIEQAEGIHGQVNYQGSPIAGINLALRFYNGDAWSTRSTTTTQADGSYLFADAPSLTAGQRYYVLYANGDYGNPPNTDYLSLWRSFDITSYSAGASMAGGDFDIADVLLASPASGATVTLPQTFAWTARSATTSDSYEFNLFNPADGNPWWRTDPPLGYVSSYALTSLPTGFSYDTQYGWTMRVYGSDGGYGHAYWGRYITFSSAVSEGIHGQVNYQGSPIAGINLALRFYNGDAWSTRSTVTTQADGSYLFTDAPSLTTSQLYYVLYNNGSDGNTDDPNHLGAWYGPDITSYTAGSSVPGGDFDIANIPLVLPADGANVTLPATFSWTRRSITSDSYRVRMYYPVGGYFGSTSLLGYVDHVNITGLPGGWPSGGQYLWWVEAHHGDTTEDFGMSYEIRLVTINYSASTTGTSMDLQGELAEGRPPDRLALRQLIEARLARLPGSEFAVDSIQRNGLAPSGATHRTAGATQAAYIVTSDLIDANHDISTPTHQVTGVAQTIYTVPNDLSDANINVSLTTDEDDHLIMTWLDDDWSQYLFYALADKNANILTPATIFQRTRHTYLWSSWNGYGNDVFSAPEGPSGPHTVYLPMVIRNYPPPPPAPPVTNGGFEQGLSGWNSGGDAQGLKPHVVTSKRHSGGYAAVLGQENAPCRADQGGLIGQSWIYQDITVPDSGSPKLVLYYRILSYDKLNADKYDRFEVYINGTLLGRFGNTNPGEWGSGRCNEPIDDLGWQPFTYDLNPYRGQTIRLRLVNITHPDDWFGTWTYVDDVSVSDYY